MVWGPMGDFNVAAKAVTIVTTDQPRLLLLQPTKADGLKKAEKPPVPSPVTIHRTLHLSFIISKPSNREAFFPH